MAATDIKFPTPIKYSVGACDMRVSKTTLQVYMDNIVSFPTQYSVISPHQFTNYLEICPQSVCKLVFQRFQYWS
jgi:hypothetical protein